MDTAAWIDDVEARVDRRLAPDRGPRALTVLFDPTCKLCQRCRVWMLGQASYVPLVFLACSEAEARLRYGGIPWLGNELVVVGDDGEVWAGPAAFLVCLWALVDWREWSFRLAAPAFAALVERFFIALSSRRRTLSAFLAPMRDHECATGTCRVR
jgi:predicted DCC family thiol-disulfide oxidoreductase YuxK